MANAQISVCEEANDATQIQLCTSNDYDKGFGHTQPVYIKERILLYDIPEFHHHEKIITIFLRLFTNWNDSRVMLKSNDLAE